MRILVFSNLFPPDYDGGLELSAAQLAQGLRARGHEVEVVTSRFRSGFEGEREDQPHVHRLLNFLPLNKWELAGASSNRFARGKIAQLSEKYRRKLAVLASFKRSLDIASVNVPAMERFLQDREFDVAYAFGAHQVGLSTTAAITRHRIPIVWHTGDYWLLERLRPIPKFRRAMKALSPKWFEIEQQTDVRNMLFISDLQRKIYASRGLTPPNSDVIPRSIDFEPVSVPGSKLHPPVFFMAARLTFDKGVHVALEAATLLHRSDNERPWKLQIAGPAIPEMRDLFEMQIAAGGIQHRVNILGKISREETLERMRRATAFLSTSLWEEPFGRTNIEAMACGTTLIASKTGAIFEIVGDSNCALLYKKESAQELATHMQTVLERPQMAREFESRGVERVRNAYTMDRILDRTEAFFAKTLNR